MADSDQSASTTSTTTTTTTTTSTTNNNNNSNNNKNGNNGIKRSVDELNSEATKFTEKKLAPRIREVNSEGKKATRWWGWGGRVGATLVECQKMESFKDTNNNNNNNNYNYNDYISVISNLNIDGDYVEKYINYNEFNDCCCGGYAVAVCMGEYRFNLIAPKNKQCYNNLCHLVSSINSI